MFMEMNQVKIKVHLYT